MAAERRRLAGVTLAAPRFGPFESVSQHVCAILTSNNPGHGRLSGPVSDRGRGVMHELIMLTILYSHDRSEQMLLLVRAINATVVSSTDNAHLVLPGALCFKVTFGFFGLFRFSAYTSKRPIPQHHHHHQSADPPCHLSPCLSQPLHNHFVLSLLCSDMRGRSCTCSISATFHIKLPESLQKPRVSSHFYTGRNFLEHRVASVFHGTSYRCDVSTSRGSSPYTPQWEGYKIVILLSPDTICLCVLK
jgi:hypothetical protein